MEKLFVGNSRWDLSVQVIKKHFIRMDVSDKETANDHAYHIAEQIAEVLKTKISKEAQIQKNSDLSKEGKEKAISQVNEAANAKFEKIKEERNVNLRIADINRKLATAYQPKTDDVLTFLKRSKLEEQLRKFKPYEIDKIFMDACQKGGKDNLSIIDTVLDSHFLAPLVNAEKIEEGIQAIKKRKYPELVIELNDLNAIERVVGRLFRAAREVLN